jgi:hypothetical protein
MIAKQTAIIGVESDEVLIADPRGGLTPAQIVDQKLLGVLGSCPRSLNGGRQAERPTTGHRSGPAWSINGVLGLQDGPPAQAAEPRTPQSMQHAFARTSQGDNQ